MATRLLRGSIPLALLIVPLILSLTGAASAGQFQERRDPALVQGAPRGQAPGAPQAAPKEYPKLPEEDVSVTSHVITLGGKPLPYTAVAGTLLLKADDGRPRANVYFTAYFRDDVRDKVQRPIAFVYNGGPGSASVWLHMGAFGPRKVVLAEDGNALPGPSRPSRRQRVHASRCDRSLLHRPGRHRLQPGRARREPGSILRLRRGHRGRRRFHPPVHDPLRALGLAEVPHRRKLRHAAVGRPLRAISRAVRRCTLNGIVLISAILNFQTARFAPMNDSAYMLFLPTYTADAWYHKKLAADLLARKLPDVLDEARAFALGEYALALLKGNTLEPAAKEAMVQKVARYTGLDPEFIANANLRISLNRFVKELLRGERRTSAGSTGGSRGFDLDAAGESYEFDPANAAISGPFPAALNAYVRGELKYKNDTPYAVSGDVRPWSYENVQNQYLNTAETLRAAMAANQFLKVFVANGYFDGATPFFATEYTFFQTDLAGDLKGRITMGYYEAGHMMYIHRPSHAKLKADIAEFIKDAAGTKK